MNYLELLKLSGNTQLLEDLEKSEGELDLLERMYQGRHGLNIDTDVMPIEEIQKRMAAASRALGIVNRIKDKEYKKQHLSRVLSNMNTIRAALQRAVGEDEVEQSANAELDDFTPHPTDLNR